MAKERKSYVQLSCAIRFDRQYPLKRHSDFNKFESSDGVELGHIMLLVNINAESYMVSV